MSPPGTQMDENTNSAAANTLSEPSHMRVYVSCVFVRLPASRDSVKISGYDGVVCFVHTLPVICSTQSSSVFPSRSPSSLLPLSVLLSLVPFSFASLHPEVPFLIEQSSVGCFTFSPPHFSNISPSDGFSRSLFPSFSLFLSPIMPSAYSPVTGK